ncbi:hypothetical protein ACROYT_G039751 [Oculina patagonica]
MVDKEMFINWLMDEGLIAKERLCPKCEEGMTLTKCADRSDSFKWECRKQVKGERHKAEISIRKGSWFEKSKMTLEEIVKLTYWWCQDLDQSQIKHELGLAESTGVDWDSFCREVCEITMFENSEKLGGEGKFMQIDESKFGKRKYHRGHHVEDRRAYLLTLLDQPAYKAVELLKLSGSLTFEEFTAQLIQRFDSGKTKEDYKLQLRARCQRPNEDFEAFADHLMELVENAYPEAAYSFKVELARDQFIQGVAISDDLREKVFMSQPASLVEAVRVVRRLESARKACQAVPSVEKKKVGECDSGIYISGLVNHSVTCILLDTGATVSVLNEETWRKSGHVSKVNPVTGTLTTANGNELTVLGETKVRFRVGNIDCFWSVMIARGLSHDCILGSDFFQHFGCQVHYDTGTFVVGHTEIPIRYSKVTPSVCRIFLSDDIQVEPGTEQVFEAKLENGYDRNTGSPGILEESKELRGKSEINIARSLVIPRDGLTIVRVANFSDRPIRLRSDFPVAEYHPISSVDGHVVPMEMDPDVTSASHPSCSVIDRPVVKDEEPMKEEKWKSSLQGNLEGLSEDQRGQFLSLVTEYADIFAKDSSDLGKSGLLEHSIDTGDCKPVKQPPRRVPPYQREVIDQQIDELLATGRVEPSQSPWSSPVVLARKHDGTYRMCIDFRKLNQSTKKDAIPLPRTDDLLVALGGAQWFSSLDLASGYWQMQVKEEDRPKTAFSTHRGQFQWTVMPFGLTNGPASFTRLMNLALNGLTWTHCLVYLDDIIIWAPTFEEHIRRLRLVFDRKRAAGLKLKPTKCRFLRKEVAFLGHVVSSDGIKTDPEKVKAVKTWPVPVNVKELQSFLGLASYYRKFILGFSIIAEPLYQLCRKNVAFTWQQEQQSAFEELKDRLVSAPVLAYPDFSPEAGSFILDTDASQYHGIGAVLSQQQEDGTERVIAYGSRSLNEHEKNYCATREPQGQVARWLERLQEYDYEVQHRPGKQHSNADSLSRRPRRNHGECPSCVPPTKSEVATVTSRLPCDHEDNEKDLRSSKNVARAQSEDPDIGPVVDRLLQEWKKPTDEELRPLSRATREIWAQWELLELREGVLYLRSSERTPSAKSRMVLPHELVKESLREVHDGLAGAHLGRMKTLKKMKTRFWRSPSVL